MSNWTDQQRSQWATYQRKQRRRGLLSSERIQKLNSIGFDWGRAKKRTRTDSTANKAKLLEMARNGECKPEWNTLLGRVLNTYTRNGNSCYDLVFDNKIREVAPQWWPDTATANKVELLRLASSGEPKPEWDTLLGSALNTYIYKSSRCYDSVFDKEIRELAPHWFEYTAAVNKAKLLEMARSGELRPKYSTSLGSALSNYTRKGVASYDPDFDREIRELEPRWWLDTTIVNKIGLLKMARNGESRPHFKTQMGVALNNYTRKCDSCYDPDFDKEIRRLAPHWFWSSKQGESR